MKKEYISPFIFRTDTSIILRNSSSKGISMERLQKLWEEGTLTEEDLTIMETLHNMVFMTSKMVQDAFSSGELPADLIRLASRRESNPYKKSLSKLEHYGIVIIYSFYNGTSIVGAKIYTLTKGADNWIEKHSAASHKYFFKNTPYNFNLPEKQITYKNILATLAANQFHLKTIAANREKILAYFPVSLKDNSIAYFYLLTHNRCILMFPVRDLNAMPATCDTIKEEVVNVTNKYHIAPSNTVVLFNTDTLEAAGQVNALLKNKETFQESKVLYITDFSIYHEPDTLKSLLHYPGAEKNLYSRVELNLS